MNILLIDDDPTHRAMYRYVMKSEGYEVMEAASGEEGLKLCMDGGIDLVILDVMLPGADGYQVCRQLRSISDVPILMVSSMATRPWQIVQALDTGADAYLFKSDDLAVLKASVRALLRRSKMSAGRSTGQSHSYVDAHLMLDLEEESVIVVGKHVHISPIEYRLLALLTCHQGHVILTSDLCEALWPRVDLEQARAYLHTYINRLRRTIEPDPEDPRYILTHHGLGYTFMPQR